MDTQYLNFAPRLGISYSPTTKTVIRTGYGIFYTQDIGNAYFDMARNIAGRVTATNTNTATGIYGNSNLTWANAAPGGTGAVSNLGPTTAFSNAVSHKTTYTEQFLLNIQQQVGQDWSFEAGYQGAVSRHLYGFMNLNSITPTDTLATAPQLPSRPAPLSRTWAGSNMCMTKARAITTLSARRPPGASATAST